MQLRIPIILIIMLHFTLFEAAVFAIDKESLWCKLSFADTPESGLEALSLAYLNLDLVEDILFISDWERDNSVARGNSINIIFNCNQYGIISDEHFLNTIFKLLAQANRIVHPGNMEEFMRRILFITGTYKMNIPYSPIESNIAGFSLLSQSILSANLVQSKELVTFLNTKMSIVKGFLKIKSTHYLLFAFTQVEEIKNCLIFHRGNSVSENAFQVLFGYCQNLQMTITSNFLSTGYQDEAKHFSREN